jgi:hypothetical protein
MADELWQRSACELAAGIRQRQFSCREVMESVAGRIRAMNGPLNAIVYDYTEEALAEASRADADLAAGRGRGPLHGVPVTIKENVDQQGKPTPNGLPALAGVIAPDDAPVVRNLRRAGAIIVGRTNTPELSMPPPPTIPCTGGPGTRGTPTRRRADRPGGPGLPPLPASGPFTTATASTTWDCRRGWSRWDSSRACRRIQIVGRRFREDLILGAMAVVEAQVGVLARTLWAREESPSPSRGTVAPSASPVGTD